MRNGVEPEGKNGRALPGSFLQSVCTEAESPEQFRAQSMEIFERAFPLVRSIGGRLLVAGK
jgi:hypothetical protein